MSNEKPRDLSAFSLLELFCVEAESQSQVLTDGLLALDRNTHDAAAIEQLMRAAHSIKGAASIVNLEAVVHLAHEMENCFVAAQRGRLQLTSDSVDALLAGVDLISRIAKLDADSAGPWFAQNQSTMDGVVAAIAALPVSPVPVKAEVTAPEPVAMRNDAAAPRLPQDMRVSVENFDQLLSLASESLVASNMLQPLLQSMRRFKKQQDAMCAVFDDLHQAIASAAVNERIKDQSIDFAQKAASLKSMLVQHMSDLESCERRLLAASQTTLDEVLALRMRPFIDGVQAFPRMVRDLGKSLGKEVRLEISGEDTKIDREILANLESPLNHLLRNAIDHGIESPEQRLASDKPREGTIRLDARHSAGLLNIHIGDDGHGVDLDRIRRAIVHRNMATEAMASAMSASELLDFLLLPGFSLKETITEVSGRGFGLDIANDVARQHYGTVKLESEPGKGFHIHITLPVTQSVVRALIIEIGGEAYALPITLVERVVRVERASIHLLEDKPFFTIDDEHIGLVSAAQLLELPGERIDDAELSAVVIGSGMRRYALAVDTVIGEKKLVVQPIDAIFGKLRDVSAAALLDDGTPVLILDVADLLQSIEKLLGEGQLRHLHDADPAAAGQVKRVLVVDDSLTVREMERQLLTARGFAVDVAVDGIDGWNAVRGQDYDLVITDIDMPRMDGIELVTQIKKDPRLRHLPVMIVSYKDRPEDRARGINAGADYYLTKGSFHDQTLLDAVVDLIGEARS